MKNSYKSIFLFITLCLSSQISVAQNSYKFIEPNISFSYDSTKIKIAQRYSNTFYETEAYSFKPTTDTVNKIDIYVTAKHPIANPASLSEQEAILQGRIAKIDTASYENVSFMELDKKVRHIGDFLCFGFILLDKKTNHTSTTIFCDHVSDADYTEVKFSSNKQQSLAADYKLLEDFFKGFRSYSKEKIFREDSLIKARYTINVAQTNETIANLKWRTNAYFVIVKTNEPLQHKVKEVRLDIGYGKEIFSPNENGEVYIACSDKEKGTIERKGEFVLLNAFGKNVKIPFTFKYQKK